MNINIISPINQLGYGIAGLNIVKSLTKENHISLWTIGRPEVTTDDDYKCVLSCTQNAQIPDFHAPCVRIWHQHDMAQFVGKGRKIGFPFFELTQFNNVEKAHLTYLDKIFVCSQWAKDIVLNNINRNTSDVCVVPLGVDVDIFQPSDIIDGPTIFFNCGKWEIRKGHDILPDIFNLAFRPDDNVELWMMCSNPFLSDEETKRWKDLYTNTNLGSKIRFIDRKNTQKEVYNIMQQIDCGVFPARAEGWNLEILELLSCGKHIITTNYSGHTEFCNTHNCLLVDIDQYETAYDGKWFHGNGGSWAKITQKEVEEFAMYMRHIHDMKQRQDLKRNNNGVDTSHTFTWRHTSEQIVKYV